MSYLGIDPGGSGALVLLDERMKWVGSVRLKATERDVETWLRAHRDDIAHAVLERVASFPGQGVSSTFKFGQSYGFCRGLLVAFRIPFEAVPPGSWMRSMGLIAPKGTPKVDRKRRLKARAQELWPDAPITNAEADAALIAEFCRRKFFNPNEAAPPGRLF